MIKKINNYFLLKIINDAWAVTHLVAIGYRITTTVYTVLNCKQEKTMSRKGQLAQLRRIQV